MSRLVISDSDLGAAERHAAASYPDECCGVLIGSFADESTVVERVLPADNERDDSRHNRYLINPESVLAAHKEARALGLDVVGYYHSHPDHPARPSEFDREHAWPGVSYLIVSVEKGNVADTRSWRLADDREKFDEEEIDLRVRSKGGRMSVTIQIPTPLRRFTSEQGEVQVDGSTVGEALSALTERFPALRRHLYTDDGTLRSFVNVFLNDEDVRHLDSGQTPVAEGDTLVIIPSIAGGALLEMETETLPNLSPAEIRHYSRHLIMPEIGTAGQRRLKAAKVLMIGTGGLGSPLGLYLAAAGVGTLGLVDFDVVDETNLHRQVLFSGKDVGRPKVEAAAERLRGINPHIRIVPHDTRLESANALDLFKDYDLVVDGTDNFPTRYLVNDACVMLGKPNVYGSIFRFEGQVSIFWGAQGPCYRCLFPEPPPPGLVPSCAEGGVLGVLPGIIGSLQANEVIKLIAGVGEPLIGRLVLFDALKMKFRELKLRKDPSCPVCSENPTQRELIDYEQFCGIGSQAESATMADDFEMTVQELRRRLDEGRELLVLDVRNPQEFEIARIEGSVLIPLHELQDRLGELDPAATIVAHCHHGPRSAQAVRFLRQMGFDRAINLAGGIDQWSLVVDRSVPRY